MSTSYDAFDEIATIEVTPKQAYTGFVYITVHMDYGLKKLAGGYSNVNNDATYNSGKSQYPAIEDGTPYHFSVAGVLASGDTVYNMNVFKHDHGIGGRCSTA